MSLYAQIFTAADEAALIAVMDAAQTAVGTTVVNALTEPVGTSWYISTGEDGLHQIVTGVVDDGVGGIETFAAADFDTGGIVAGVGGNKAGWVSDDSVALEIVNPGGGYSLTARQQVRTGAATWVPRDPASSYVGMISATKNSLSLITWFLSGGVLAQGCVYLGKSKSHHPALYAQARAKIDSISGAGNIRTIELTENINAAIKDTGAGGANYPDDPRQQYLFFQSIVGGGPDSGFAMTERQVIEPGSLTTNGSGNTQFDVDVQNGVKLFAVGGRYDLGDGAGDLVSVVSETNICISGASNDFGFKFYTGQQTMLSAWDMWGGQRGGASNPRLFGVNRKSFNTSNTNDPTKLANRHAWYPIYIVQSTVESGAIAQANNEGAGLIGTLEPTLIFVTNYPAPDMSLYRIDSDANRGYRLMENGKPLGLRPFNSGVNDEFNEDVMYAVGPGF